MIRALNRLLSVHYNYENPVVQQRATNLQRMNFALLLIDSLLVLILIAQSLSQNGPGASAVSGLTVINLGLFISVFLLIQRGRLVLAEWIFILFLGLAILPGLTSDTTSIYYAPVIILLLAAGLLLSPRALFVVFLAVIAALILRYLNLSEAITPLRVIPAQTAPVEIMLALVVYMVIVAFLMAFSGTSDRVIKASFADIHQLIAANNFGKGLSEAQPETTIFTHLMQVAQSELEYELVQIYLPDDYGNYERQLRLSFDGASRKVSLSQSDLSVLTEAIRTRQPVVVNWRDTSFRAEHLISPARQSCTLAIIELDTVVAVLDVQTIRERAFTSNELVVLSSLVEHTSRELDYSSTIHDLQNTVREQEAVIARFTRQLTDAQGRGRQVTTSGWEQYFGARVGEAFGFDLVGEQGKLTSIRSDALPEAIRQTLLQGDVHVQHGDREQAVTVPILFRDTVLGAMSFNVPTDRPVTERQIELIRTVADRLSVALENNRLLEQTQAQARRERQASEIGSVLLSATNVETVLSLAAESFNEAFGAVHTRVYLQPGTLMKSGDAT